MQTRSLSSPHNFRFMSSSSSSSSIFKNHIPPSPYPETPLSVCTTEFSTPPNEISCVTFVEGGDESSSYNGEEEIKVAHSSQLCMKDAKTVKHNIHYKNNLRANAKSVRTNRSLFFCKLDTTSLRVSSQPTDYTSLPMLGIAYEHPTHDSIRDSNVNTYGDSDLDGTKSPFELEEGFLKDFTSEKRNKFEAKLKGWKESQWDKLMNRLRMKEAEITAWEYKETTRARIHLVKMEGELERRRLKAFEDMEEQISKAEKKADKKKAKERRSTAMKISKTSKLAEEATATGKLPWWKSVFQMQMVVKG